MGITTDCARFLLHAKREGVDFNRTLMVGRQHLYLNSNQFGKSLSSHLADKLDAVKKSHFAEPLFEALGAEQVDSLDYSDYEGANLIFDLNKPIPQHLRNTYSVIFDGGTLEHIFDFPLAVRNCMDMLRPGGHMIMITPCNNQSGHGLYQFSPELMYSLFSSHNGFSVLCLYVGVEHGASTRHWFEVADPKQVKSRVTFRNEKPTYLLLLAKKLRAVEGDLVVFQSDYEEIWRESKYSAEPAYAGALLLAYKRLVPVGVREFIYRLRHPAAAGRYVRGLGYGDPRYFRRVNVES